MKKTRGYGNGTLERLPGGKVRATIYLDGKRSRKTLRTEALARDWLEETKAAHRMAKARGDAPDRDGTNPDAKLGDVMQEWFDRRKAGTWGRKLKPGTAYGHEKAIAIVVKGWGRLTLRDALAPGRLNKIVGEMVKRKTRSGKRWSNSTVRNRINLVTATLEYAMGQGYVRGQKLSVKRPSMAGKTRKPLERDQVAKLLNVAEEMGPRELLAIRLGVHAGLRLNEARMLTLAMVDQVNSELNLPAELTKASRDRQIPIPRDLARLFSRVEPYSNGTFLNQPQWNEHTSFARWLTFIFESAGLDYGFHVLRHTWATMLGEDGAHPSALMAWGGWRSLDMVMRYCKPRTHRRDVVDSAFTRTGTV